MRLWSIPVLARELEALRAGSEFGRYKQNRKNIISTGLLRNIERLCGFSPVHLLSALLIATKALRVSSSSILNNSLFFLTCCKYKTPRKDSKHLNPCLLPILTPGPLFLTTMKLLTSSALLSFLPVVSSQFYLVSPKARGFDENKLATFPCGGQDTVGDRTPWPMKGGRIQLNMTHDQAAVQVLLGLGNDVGEHFNIVLHPTVQERGIGYFCLESLLEPESLGIKDGHNATIQVVTNGDPNGGLYNCADIIFQTPTRVMECHNDHGVGMTKYTGDKANANGTDSSGVFSALPSSATGSPSRTAPVPGATSSHVAATQAMEVRGWDFLGVMGAVMGAVIASM